MLICAEEHPSQELTPSNMERTQQKTGQAVFLGITWAGI